MRAARTRKFRRTCVDQVPDNGCHDIFGGGGGTTTTNTVQNSDPWSGVQPYMQDVFARARGLYERGAYTATPFITPQSFYTQRAQDRQAYRASEGSPLLPAAQSEALKTIGGDYLSADSNPYLKGAVQQALDQAKMGVSGQFSGDNYGGSANQEWLGRTLANTALPIYAQNYQTERGRQLATTGAAPSLAAADYTDIGQLATLGASQEQRGQAEIQASRDAFQGEPWENLFNYQRALAGSQGYGQTSGSGQQPYYTNPLSSALGLGIGGLGLYSGLSGAGLLGGAGAAGAGAALGSGLTASASTWPMMFGFSDRRLKTNVRRVGTHPLGIGIYTYDIFGQRQIGVMADEMEAVLPDAVVQIGGFKAVDYGKVSGRL